MSQRRRIPWVREAIRRGAKYHHREKNPWVHNALNVGLVAALVGAFGAIMAAGDAVSPWLYIPVAGFAFGLLLFGLFVLVVHEASHGMFVISKNKRWARLVNRLFGWAVSFLLAVDYHEHWEVGHLEHHVRPIEEDDPQKYNRTTGPELFSTVLKLMLIPGYAYVHRFMNRDVDRTSHTGTMPKVAFFAIWITLFVVGGVLVSWTVPIALLLGLQNLTALNQVKGALEHGGEIAFEESPFLRSRSSFFPLRRLLMPMNITLHFEHHLNFTIPWYELPNYHAEIRELVPEPLREEFFNTDILAQLRGEKGGLTDEQRRIALRESSPALDAAEAAAE